MTGIPSIRRFGLFALLCALSLAAFSISAQVKRQELEDFVLEQSAAYRNLRWLAEARAWRLGLPVRRTLPSGAIIELQRFVDGRPLYYMTDNENAADTVSTDEVWPGGSLGLSLDGAGQTLGIWDGGSVRGSHQELVGRVTNFDSAALSNHATHVAGTMIGAGMSAGATGMSFAADLRAYDFNDDETEMATEQLTADPVQISNHSYGFISGWIFDLFNDGLWVWFGDAVVNSQEDPIFGLYESSARAWDQIAFNSPNYLMVKSAGNDRNDAGPSPGMLHWHFDSGINRFVLSNDSHPADGGTSGYDTIVGGSGSSKNILTVGAVEDISGGYVDSADVVISGFSGWGPTDDGRIKPDIVANGINLFSSIAASDTAYASFSGTSMSAPNTSGSLGLLSQHADDLFKSALRASTLRALVIHTADEAGPHPGPDYMHGWGLLNTASAAQVMTDHAAAQHTEYILEMDLSNGMMRALDFSSDGSTPFRATIAWTDLPGTPPVFSVDPPDSMLVNDIDLRVVDPDGVIHAPWVLSPATPSAAATRGDNFRDNVEQVHIDATVSGTYTIEISHKASLVGGTPQTVSLIVSGNADVEIGGTEVIVDNLDTNTTQTGTWSLSSVSGPWAGQSLYSRSNSTFRWLPTLPAAGTYDVYAWWTPAPNRSNNVPYRINHSSGVATVHVDQSDSSTAGKWNLLGSFTFGGGSGSYVEVSSENGLAVADAIRLVSAPSAPLSIVTWSLPDAAVGESYSKIVLASGGIPPYAWTLLGSVPSGLSLNSGTGEISGIPTTEGAAAFTVRVTDTGGNTAERALSLTVVAAIPPGTEVIVDNLDANTTQTGTWSLSSVSGPWAGQSLYSRSSSTFRWLPTLPAAATYDVYAWWTPAPNRSNNVPYRINHSSGVAAVHVDQSDSSTAGKWNLLGSFTFGGGSGSYVEVSSENGLAIADAVRLELK